MPITTNSQELPVAIVGSSKFGIHDIISAERTYNMFVSDGWLVNFSGYNLSLRATLAQAEGRGCFHSVRGNFVLMFVAGGVYRANNLTDTPVFIFSLNTSSGEVFADENLASQIMIVDGVDAWIYNWRTGNFGRPSVILTQVGAGSLIPNYVTYQNLRFIVGNGATTAEGSQWYGYSPATAGPNMDIELSSDYITLTLQTKPDYAKAALRIPGKGNSILVFGTTVCEIWQDVGDPVTSYRRNSTVNIDYGCASVATIGASDDYIAWLGINEKSAPSIMVMTGGSAERLSTDGIDDLLSTVDVPSDSTAIFYRQDGHVFYILTFFNPLDNFTITYDFTTGKFYDLTDWDFTYHPARQVVYFKNNICFISRKDGHLYEMSNRDTSYSVNDQQVYQIPRVRVCDTQRFPRPEKFRVNLLTFTLENGTEPGENFAQDCVGHILMEDTGLYMLTEEGLPLLLENGSCGLYQPRIDVSISKDGGRTFGNVVPYYMHPTGYYKCQPRFPRLGTCNLFTSQFRFWGFWRFTINNGYIEVSS